MLKTDNTSPAGVPGKPLLLFPPFADPTWPYVALPTLKAYLRQRGIEVIVRDLNVMGSGLEKSFKKTRRRAGRFSGETPWPGPLISAATNE